MKPQKRKCSSKCRDRLSEMPDEVIVYILSYLSIVNAVRTMLIRPFGNLWTLVPTLDFHLERFEDNFDPDCSFIGIDIIRRFFIFIRNVLMLHKRPLIHKFRLCFQYDDIASEFGDDIRMCLKFALDKQAKKIDYTEGSIAVELSKSPDFPNFISQSLVTLQLDSFSIYPELEVELGSLKELLLDHMTMSEEGFQKFICGCPSLQVLHIYNPYEIRNLSFSAPNIRKLFLNFVEEDSDNEPWLLDFPNLESLDLSQFYEMPYVGHIDVSSVRDVDLSVPTFKMDDENKLGTFKLFLEKFSQSEVFRLSSDFASEAFLHLLDDLHLLQIRWKRITLPLRIFCQSCLLGVYQMMRLSIDLEELDIRTDTTNACSANIDLPPVELSNPLVLPKLKTVTLRGYTKPWKHQLQLVEFLLKNAAVLEKLVIVPNKPQLTVQEKLDKLDFVMDVSRLQRSSPRARVLFL